MGVQVGRLAGAGALVVAASLGVSGGMDSSRDVAIALFSDDAYYYLKIAASIWEGNGSSFDGIAPTNGYHPLWMIFLVAIQALAGSSIESALSLVLGLSLALTVATLALVYITAQRYLAPGYGPLAVAPCFLPTVLTAMTNGLETGLLLLSIAFTIWAICRWSLNAFPSGFRRGAAYGLLLAVCFLSRLDAIFLFAAAVGLQSISLLSSGVRIRQVAAHLVPILVGFSIAALPYFVWNLHGFGHLMPISGAVKSSLPEFRNSFSLIGDMLFGLVLLIATAGLVALTAVLDRRRGSRVGEILSSPVVLLTLACAFHFLHAFLFLTWGVYWWHFAPYGLAFALALAQAAQRLLGTARAWGRPLAMASAGLIAIAGIALQVTRVENEGRRHRIWFEAAEWARSNTEPDDIFALKDAGLFGYFSQRTVINLDGKANSYTFREYLREGSVEEYLKAADVRYLADVACRYRDGSCSIVLPRPNRPELRLMMREAEQVYRGPPSPPRAFQTRRREPATFTIWDLAQIEFAPADPLRAEP